MNLEWISFGVKPSLTKNFITFSILNFIHFKGYRQHSCFRQLYKTNYLIEWLASSHGYLWQMYQLRRKKTLPIVLPSMVKAENFSDHPVSLLLFTWIIKVICAVLWRTPGRLKPKNTKGAWDKNNIKLSMSPCHRNNVCGLL
jgi:hypothetical protein